MWLPTSQMCPHIRGRGPGSVTAQPCDLRQGPLSLGLIFSVCTKKGSGWGEFLSLEGNSVPYTLRCTSNTKQCSSHPQGNEPSLVCSLGVSGSVFPTFHPKTKGSKETHSLSSAIGEEWSGLRVTAKKGSSGERQVHLQKTSPSQPPSVARWQRG